VFQKNKRIFGTPALGTYGPLTRREPSLIITHFPHCLGEFRRIYLLDAKEIFYPGICNDKSHLLMKKGQKFYLFSCLKK
jgi:hypothetical protein